MQSPAPAPASASGKAIWLPPELLPGQPNDGCGEPVFADPWMAQAFAMTVKLHEQGLFTWPGWAAARSDEIKRAQADGDPDLGDTYYQHWLAELERLVKEKGASSATELTERKDAWDRASKATPHGQPILLENG